MATSSTSEGAVSMTHAAIAGAGLVGRLLAWRLARSGWQVSLFDRAGRGDRTSAAHVAAAMLSPLAERASADAEVFALAQRAMVLWPEWLDELHQDSGQAVYHRREGTLVVAHPADRPMLTQLEQVLRQKLPAAHHSAVKPVGRERLGELEPALAGRFENGLHLETDGQLANDQLLEGLSVALDRLRVDWHEHCAVQSLADGVVQTSDGPVPADLLIDARGIGAQKAWSGLRGVRGEVLTVECEGLSFNRPVRLMHPRYQLYIAPRPGHRFIVGATELESEDAGPVTLRSVLELGSALYSLHPAFGEARVIDLAAGLRPAFDDHRPALRQQRGVWEINGLYRHGYLCAPALVEQLLRQAVR